MLQGLYKVEMHTVHGRAAAYLRPCGKMMGGNSVCLHRHLPGVGGGVSVDISTLRHKEDPNYQPLFKSDRINLTLKGRQQGEQYVFEGGSPQLPDVVVNSVMTPISEAAAPPVIPGRAGGIRNGLYSIHIRMLDGIDGGNTGVMVLHNGKIRGGDAFFDYVGSTPAPTANGRARSSITSTPSKASGRCSAATVGIGFSGTYTDDGAVGKPLRSPASAASASARC
jgi:hypothetical protein